jgi:hypothetical protein
MSVLHINNITNKEGTGGPTIAGITTVDSTGFMKVPVGSTGRRLVSDFVPNSIIDDGLVLYLDAGNIQSYPGSGTIWTDLSGNGNTGTLVNGPTYSSANGGSLVFDGVDDYVNAPLTKTATCTFSCWARTTTLAGSGPMLFNAGPNGVGPDLFFYSGNIYWNTWDGAGNPFATTPASVTDGNYHYYVVVNDASSNTKLYYDGNLLGTAAYRTAANNTNLTIGGTTDTYMWNGNISNFSIHNRALTAQEVQQNFNATRSRFSI